MRRILATMAGVIVFVMTLVATTNAANACVMVFHEPDLPESLQD